MQCYRHSQSDYNLHKWNFLKILLMQCQKSDVYLKLIDKTHSWLKFIPFFHFLQPFLHSNPIKFAVEVETINL